MTDVLQLLEAYASAALAKDARAMLDLYRPDVRVFDLWGTWSYEGADAWRRAIEDWFGSLGSESVRVSFDDVRHRGARDTAVVTAFVTYEAWSAEGKSFGKCRTA